MSFSKRKLKLLLVAMLFLTGVATLLWQLHESTLSLLPWQEVESRPVRIIASSSSAPLAVFPTEEEPFPRRPDGAIANELLMRFPSAVEMERFIDQATRRGIRIKGVISSLNTVRLGFKSPSQESEIRKLASESAEIGFNFIVLTPDLLSPAAAQSYRAFHNQALPWLGVPADNQSWGTGIAVAILDTGVSPHPTFASTNLTELDLLESETVSTDYQDHGTAVASILAGSLPYAMGIAPSVDILSIKVLDGDGLGDSFTLAQGIMEAVDRGVNIINLSLGSYGESFILREAINYALQQNVAIVAAAGNDGIEGLPFPARYEGVLGVTAVDANGRHAAFANVGSEVDLAAPGIGINTAWGHDQWVSLSGTSASTPFVAGALAAILSENPQMQTEEAVHLLFQYANDASALGPDDKLGWGILNIERVTNRDQHNIYDAAIADYYLVFNEMTKDVSPLWITVQNRGTEWLGNLRLEVEFGQQRQTYYLGNFNVGEVKGQQLLLSSAQLLDTRGIEIRSRVVTDGLEDTKPANNFKASLIRLIPATSSEH